MVSCMFAVDSIFMTSFSLSGRRVKHWAPFFFCLLPSCMYSLISTCGSFLAESSSSGPIAGLPKGFCWEAVSGGRQGNGSTFQGPFAFSKQPCFELFLRATCSLELPLSAELCLMHEQPNPSMTLRSCYKC